ncbi:MAG TPA: hypothetical protein VHB25_21880 [Gemmatimonadaceae bacterium]|nr:hypothetical protein [Gemmatimonadaceae bacterium]
MGGGAADNYYNRLPALVGDDIPMRVARPQLWPRTLAFYNIVRNPVVHGHQLSDVSNERFAELFDYIADVYDWIDSWNVVDEMFKGAQQSFVVRRPDPAT